MKIKQKENRIYFDNDTAYGNITIHDNYIKIELIRVHEQYRGKGFANKLLHNIIQYIKTNLKQRKIMLSPMPLSTGGKKDTILNLQQLMTFYKKHKFREAKERTREEPYLMVKYL